MLVVKRIHCILCTPHLVGTILLYSLYATAVRLLDHPSENITRGTARMSGVPLTGTQRPCVQCSESRVRRYAVPKSTESLTNERAERFFIDITGPFHATYLGGHRYAMLCVDDFTRFQFIRFLKHKRDAAKELLKLVAEHIAPLGIKIGTVRTDGGGEFEGEFQSLLELRIKRETTPPHTPQYNGVVERALVLLQDKTVAHVQVVMRQAIIWRPRTGAGEAVSSDTATKGGGRGATRHYSPRPKKTSHYTSSLGNREDVSVESESEQHEQEGAREPEGAFELERVKHETGGAFGPEGATLEELEPDKSFPPEPEADESGDDSSDDESEPEPDQGGHSGAHQEVPPAVRKLYDSCTGSLQPITQSRTRSGRDAASLQAPMRAVDVNHLPPEPTTLRKAQAPPEWPNWQRGRKKQNGRATHAGG